MSSVSAVRAALETALATINPPVATAHENALFTPTQGAPYQQVNLLCAAPDEPELSGGYFEQGIFQVTLAYPKDGGPGPAQAQAELIRAKFPKAASFVAGGVTTNITATPEVAPARIEDDRYLVPVKVRFSARIAS